MTRRFFLLILASLLLTGCTHRAKWLHGSWVFDGERTAQVLEQQSGRTGEERSIIDGLKDLATGLMAPPLIAKYQGTRIEFTDKEVLLTDRAGMGTPRPTKCSSHRTKIPSGSSTPMVRLSPIIEKENTCGGWWLGRAASECTSAG